MFDVRREILNQRVHKYSLFFDNRPMAYSQALTLLEDDGFFRARLTSVLCESPFPAYRWETPPITSATASRNFEFVLVNQPELDRQADTESFARYFCDRSAEIVVFENLGGDATLVVPVPAVSTHQASNEVYVHLASFLRGAPPSQAHQLWNSVSRSVQNSLDKFPLWLNTAGDGVAWLHVRLDSQPKYYCYTPYTHHTQAATRD